MARERRGSRRRSTGRGALALGLLVSAGAHAAAIGGLVLSRWIRPAAEPAPSIAPVIELAPSGEPGRVEVLTVPPLEEPEPTLEPSAQVSSVASPLRIPPPFMTREPEELLVHEHREIPFGPEPPPPSLRPLPSQPETTAAAPTEAPAEPGAEGVAWVEAPEPLAENLPPRYPPRARRRGLEGLVLLRVEVGMEGAVTRCEVLESSGHGILDDAARDAVHAWRYAPALDARGLPVPAVIDVPVRFVLR
jgi:protein TonB